MGNQDEENNKEVAITSSLKEVPETLHQIGQDSWFQVGLVLSTSVDCAYALGYGGTIMVPLGWIGGVTGLILSNIMSLYASTLMAKIHEYGDKRHIRFRDLAGFMYGQKAYAIVWGLQYASLFLINIGFIILGGQALKAFYLLFKEDHQMKLPYFIVIAGLACVAFAISVPHLSALRVWLAVSTFLSIVYFTVAFALSLKDGINSPPRDYSIPGSTTNRIFSTIGAAASLVFVYNTGMIPEIQATVRAPVVDNMLKALYFQFTVGVVPVHAVTYMGYWAYGSKSSSYLLNNVSGPVWLRALANLAAFLQSIIALHIFASPTYEYLDTRYGIKGSALTLGNLAFRTVVRGGYLALTIFLSALLPFLGDFMSFTGAISIIPLTFIIPNHMYIVAMRKQLSSLQKSWHWLNIVVFSCFAVAALIASLRLIAMDSKTYHAFADL